MSTNLNTVSRGVKDTWGNLAKRQRVTVISGAALVLVILLVVVLTTARGTPYEVLWSNLDPQDGGTIISELERGGIPYKLSDSGTIMVPSDRVHRTRLSLASQGLPASGVVGFESMGTKGVFSTDFERKVQYMRALSGELARTIKSIQGVEDARVHIVTPEPSLFVSQKQPATAAVLVKVRPMMELSAPSVQGIVNLVASSVEGLSRQDVTVIDGSGKLLSHDYAPSSPEGEAVLATGALLDLTAKVERELERRLMALLTPVAGAGNVVCQVRAVLNADQVKITKTSYSTEGDGILRSHQETSEAYSGTGSPGGASGGLDVPTYTDGGTGQSDFTRTESIKNFEVDQETRETIVMPGTVENLSVAVILNQNLDEEKRGIISETVSAALGLDPLRRDRITVTGMPFDTSLAEKIQEAFAGDEGGLGRWPVYAIAVGAALAVGTAVILLLRRGRRSEEVPPLQLPVLEEAATLSPESLPGRKTKKTVEQMAQQDPVAVASLIKFWLMEDE